MKLCKDCQHVVNPLAGCANTAKCNAPAADVCPVTGITDQFCTRARKTPEKCGPEARWFEPKK